MPAVSSAARIVGTSDGVASCRVETFTVIQRSCDTEFAVPLPELFDGLGDDPGADLDDAPRVLGDGDEVGGADAPECRMVPPQQRFEPDRGTVGERDDRLIDETELGAIERVTQRVLPVEAARGPLAQRLVEDRRPRPSAVLGLVHRRVGVAEQGLAGVVVGGMGDADACRQEQLVSVDGDGSFEHGMDPSREHIGVDAIRRRVQEDELVATETSDELVGERGGQSFGGRPEHLVTSLMSDPVVDDLEPIEVDEQDDDRIAVQFATSAEARRAG